MLSSLGSTCPGWWYLPLWKIWVRQLGWWHSQYMESYESHVPNHQPVSYLVSLGGARNPWFPSPQNWTALRLLWTAEPGNMSWFFVQIWLRTDYDILWDNSGPFSLGQINSDKLCHAHPIFDFGVKIQKWKHRPQTMRYSIILGYDMIIMIWYNWQTMLWVKLILSKWDGDLIQMLLGNYSWWGSLVQTPGVTL